MTSEIAEDNEDFDEAEDNDEFNEAEITVADSSSISVAGQAINEHYDFDKNTIIVRLQILPVNSESRKVLISAGIVGKPPIMSNTTITEIELVPAIALALTKLKQNLPQIAASAQQRQKTQHKLQNSQQKQTVPLPELPQPNSTPTKSSNQLSLF